MERIQNSVMWASYKAQRDFLMNVKYDSSKIRLNKTSPGTAPILERRLWHGMRSKGNPKALASSSAGWCSTYANAGSLGTGTYFAPSPHYSMGGYASQCKEGSQLFLADVLTGVKLHLCT